MSYTSHPYPTQEFQNNSHARRRRTPSRYYTSIQQMTKLHSKSSKKQKSQSPVEEESPLNSANISDRNAGIECILPGKTNKIRLSVIIRKQPKPTTKQRKIFVPAAPTPQKKKSEQIPKNNSLLDTLLEVVQKIQNDENQNSKPQENQKNMGSSHQQDYRREYKMRKQKQEEQKYLRYYQKYQGILEKLEDMERQLVFI